MTRAEANAALNCLGSYVKHCAGCPFNPDPGERWPYGCITGERRIAELIAKMVDKSEDVARGTDDD